MNFKRLVETVQKNIRRTPYQAIAASMVMFLTILVALIFVLLALGSLQVIRYYESRPQAIAFFKSNISDSDIASIENALKETGKVTKLKYVSKAEALDIYREKNKSNPILLELVTANILPSSLEISTQKPEDLAPIVEIVKKEPVVEEVIYPEDVIKTLSNTAHFIRYLGYGSVSFLLIFSVLAILMIVGFKIRIQRNEIETMRLLGASNAFIRAPYIAEGCFYGLAGSFLAWIICYALLWYAGPFVQKFVGAVPLLPIPILSMFLLLIFALSISCLIGGLGSYLAVRRYLKL